MNEPFDRGNINEASLAATERLRARMMAQPAGGARPAQRSVLPWALAAALFAFAAGIIANPWFEQAVRGRLPFLPAPAVAADPATAALAARLKALEARAGTAAPGAPAERLAATEARVDSSTDQIERDAQRIDALTAQVSQLAARLAVEEARDANLVAAIQGSADRAEAMLTVLLLRRAVAAGRPLDALLPAARRLFEPRHADAVAALAALSAQPVTRDGLARDLAGLADASLGAARPNWWQAFMGRVQAAFSGAATGSPVAQAQQAMARGDLAGAAARLRASPARAEPQVRAWLAATDRLQAADAALAELEGAAADAVPPPVPLPLPAAPPAPGLRKDR